MARYCDGITSTVVVTIVVLFMSHVATAEMPYADAVGKEICKLAGGYIRPALATEAVNYGFDKLCEECSDAQDLANSAALGVNSFGYCMSTGRSATECTAYGLMCQAASAAASELNPFSAFIQIFPPISAACTGGAVYKCCKTSGAPCHTAFNEPAPINCEGGNYDNPHGVGLCLGGGLFQGCTCAYLPQCAESSNDDKPCEDGSSGEHSTFHAAHKGTKSSSSTPHHKTAKKHSSGHPAKDKPRRTSEVDAGAFPLPAAATTTLVGRDPNSTNITGGLYTVLPNGMLDWVPTVWTNELSVLVDPNGQLSYFMLEGRIWAAVQKLLDVVTEEMQAAAQPRNSSIGEDTVRGFVRSPMTDVALGRGCKNWVFDLGKRPLWYTGDSKPGVQQHASWNDRYRRYQTLVVDAVLRIANVLPHFWARISFVQRWVWNPEDIAAALFAGKVIPSTNVTEPERRNAARAILLQYFSPASMWVIERTFPNSWQLLSVPMDVFRLGRNFTDATPMPGSGPWMMDACHQSQPLVISSIQQQQLAPNAPTPPQCFVSSDAGGEAPSSRAPEVQVVVSFVVTDTEQSAATRFGLPVSIDWGDGMIQVERIFVASSNASTTNISVCFAHLYREATNEGLTNTTSRRIVSIRGSTFVVTNITAQTMNTAGLLGGFVTQVHWPAPAISENTTASNDPTVPGSITGFWLNGTIETHRWFGDGTLYYTVRAWAADPVAVTLEKTVVSNAEALIAYYQNLSANPNASAAQKHQWQKDIQHEEDVIASTTNNTDFQSQWAYDVVGPASAMFVKGYSPYAGWDVGFPWNGSFAVSSSAVWARGTPLRAIDIECYATTGYYYAWAQVYVSNLHVRRADGTIFNVVPSRVVQITSAWNATSNQTIVTTTDVPWAPAFAGFGPVYCPTAFPVTRFVAYLPADAKSYRRWVAPPSNGSHALLPPATLLKAPVVFQEALPLGIIPQV